MCKHGRPKEADTSTLYCFEYAGCIITDEQNLHIQRCLPETLVLNGYGQTEAVGFVLTFNPTNQKHLKLLERYPNSAGKPVSGYSYKVLK